MAKKEAPAGVAPDAGAEKGVRTKNDLHPSTSPPRRQAGRPEFHLTLRPEPGVDGVQALRAALRRLLRDHGLRATRISSVGGSAGPDIGEGEQ